MANWNKKKNDAVKKQEPSHLTHMTWNELTEPKKNKRKRYHFFLVIFVTLNINLPSHINLIILIYNESL